MFKFNFNSQDKVEESAKSETENSTTWIPPQRHLITDDHLKSIDKYKILDTIEIQDTVLHIINLEELKSHFSKADKSKDVFKTMLTRNDLTPSVYEGGFKIWECTWDVLHYIQEEKLDLKDKRVLDLGCGGGLLGIFAMHNGARVVLQDYNCDVLNLFTIPNFLINFRQYSESLNENSSSSPQNTSDLANNINDLDNFNVDSLNEKFKFYFGDWKGLSDLILNVKDAHCDKFQTVVENKMNSNNNHLNDGESSKESSIVDDGGSNRKSSIVDDKLTSSNGNKLDTIVSSAKKIKRDVENSTNTIDVAINRSEENSYKDSLKFDLIVTSETIYNVDNYGKLLETMAHTLKKDGTILVSAKVHYFGVGGSTLEFKNFIIKDGRFTIDVYPINNEGVSREIIVLKFKNGQKQT